MLAGNPGIREKRENYDLMTILLLCLGSAKDETENRALELLNVLLSAEEKPEQKLRVLEHDFQIPVSQQFDKEVSQMCNLSQGILERGREEEKRETAITLFKMGMSIEKIAEAVRASINLVQEWISGSENGNVSPTR